MPDLFDTLRDVPPAPGSAADARRRGDSIRRRRTASVVAASALATALVAGGVAWSQVGSPTTAPDPAAPTPPAPTATATPTATPTEATDTPVRTAIDPDFPLADGWPEATGEDYELEGPSPRQAAYDQVYVCSEILTDVVPPGADRLGARLIGIVSGGDRVLVTYRDEAAARAAADEVVRRLDGCPATASPPPGEEVFVSEVAPTGLGDDGRRVTMGSQVGGEWALYSTIYHVVRVGNAVLMTFDGGEGGGSDAAVAFEQRTSAKALAGVVEAMCVYRDASC